VAILTDMAIKATDIDESKAEEGSPPRRRAHESETLGRRGGQRERGPRALSSRSSK
jgi:hypothetical protein